MGEIIKNNLKITQRNAFLKECECASLSSPIFVVF